MTLSEYSLGAETKQGRDIASAASGQKSKVVTLSEYSLGAESKVVTLHEQETKQSRARDTYGVQPGGQKQNKVVTLSEYSLEGRNKARS